VTTNFTLLLRQTVTKNLSQNIKKWDVSVSKMKQWESTLLKILMDTGWKLFLQNSSDSLLSMKNVLLEIYRFPQDIF